MAVRTYYSGGDWQRPLTTALRAEPELELPVRKGHPMRDFEAAPAPPPRSPFDEGVKLYKDGLRLRNYVPLDSVHLLQRYNEDSLITAVLHGPADYPKPFLAPPRPPKEVRDARRREAIHRWGTLGSSLVVAGGVGLWASGGLAHRKLQTAPESEYPELLERGQQHEHLGAALFITRLTTTAVVWTVPW